MDLKVKEVADLLNVSEVLVQDWATAGKIPSYRLDQQYRFSRTEIESWVMTHQLGEKGHFAFEEGVRAKSSDEVDIPSRRGMQQFSLYRSN